MKFKHVLSALIVSSAALAATSNASVVVTDFVNSNPDATVNQTTPFSFQHILTDQGFLFGTTHYSSGTLSIRLTDGSGREDGKITYGSQFVTTAEIANGTRDDPTPAGTFYTFALNSVALADLNADGIINITISSTNNQFFFADSTLTLVDDSSGSVPEPMSLALMFAGLAGVVASRRRKH